MEGYEYIPFKETIFVSNLWLRLLNVMSTALNSVKFGLIANTYCMSILISSSSKEHCQQCLKHDVIVLGAKRSCFGEFCQKWNNKRTSFHLLLENPFYPISKAQFYEGKNRIRNENEFECSWFMV